MSGILDAINSFFDSNPEIANLKQCTKCWWSGYLGKVCSNATPTPAPISTINQAQTCNNYTTDSPTANAVENETPRISYQQTDNISRGGDNTDVYNAVSGSFYLAKTVIFNNTSPTNSINKLIYKAYYSYDPSTSHEVKITVQGSGTENIEVQETVLSMALATPKAVTLSQEYTAPTVTVRVYLKDNDNSNSVHNTTLQAYGKDKTTVIYQ